MKRILLFLIFINIYFFCNGQKSNHFNFLEDFFNEVKTKEYSYYKFFSGKVSVGEIGSSNTLDAYKYTNSRLFKNLEFVIGKSCKQCFNNTGDEIWFIYPYEKTKKISCCFEIKKSKNKYFINTFSTSPDAILFNQNQKEFIKSLFSKCDSSSNSNIPKPAISKPIVATRSSLQKQIEVLEGKLRNKQKELYTEKETNKNLKDQLSKIKNGNFVLKTIDCSGLNVLIDSIEKEFSRLKRDSIYLSEKMDSLSREMRRIRIERCEDAEKNSVAELQLNTVFKRVRDLNLKDEKRLKLQTIELDENEWEEFSDTLWSVISTHRSCLNCEQVIEYTKILKKNKGNIRKFIYNENDKSSDKVAKVSTEILTVLKIALDKNPNDECNNELRKIVKQLPSYIKIWKSSTELQSLITKSRNDFNNKEYLKTFAQLIDYEGAVASLDPYLKSEFYYYLGEILLWNLGEIEQQYYAFELVGDDERMKLLQNRVGNGKMYLERSIKIAELELFKKNQKTIENLDNSDFIYSRLAKQSLLKFN